MVTILIFIAVIGVLVLVHEWGHFIMARRAGMKVEEFGFGFPPRIWSKKKGGTVYSINLIPLGGFVKILGEDGKHRDEAGSFSSKSISSRLKVVLAGVVMNIFLAIILLIAGNFMGLRVELTDQGLIDRAHDKKIQIANVASGSPAEKAGLLLLDEITGFKGVDGNIVNVSHTSEVKDFIGKNLGRKIEIVIRRGRDIVVKEIEPRLNPPPGEGALGIEMAWTGVIYYPWYESIWRGVYAAYFILINTFYGLVSLFTESGGLAKVSGPIGIAFYTGQAARIGVSFLIQFMAAISISLAVFNILPVSPLDGGKMLFLIIEKLKGSPVNSKIETVVSTVALAILIPLIIYVSIQDVHKFF